MVRYFTNETTTTFQPYSPETKKIPIHSSILSSSLLVASEEERKFNLIKKNHSSILTDQQDCLGMSFLGSNLPLSDMVPNDPTQEDLTLKNLDGLESRGSTADQHKTFLNKMKLNYKHGAEVENSCRRTSRSCPTCTKQGALSPSHHGGAEFFPLPLSRRSKNGESKCFQMEGINTDEVLNKAAFPIQLETMPVIEYIY